MAKAIFVEAAPFNDIETEIRREYDGALKVGELATMLGISELHTGDSAVFTWRGNVGVARISHAKSNSLFRSIWQVTLRDTPMSRP